MADSLFVRLKYFLSVPKEFNAIHKQDEGMFNTELIHTILTPKQSLELSPESIKGTNVKAYTLSSWNKSYNSDLSLSPLLHNFIKSIWKSD